MLEYIILGGIALLLILVIVLLLKKPDDREIRALEAKIAELSRLRAAETGAAIENLRRAVTAGQEQNAAAAARQSAQMLDVLDKQMTMFRSVVQEQMRSTGDAVTKLSETNAWNLEQIRTSVTASVRDLQEENGKKLDEIRGTVDEKLQTALEKRISESFKTVSEQLEQVYKGLGEMQTLASDVGGLKKVLSGVKTRGILGEIQLGAILEEILPREQYETNVATVPHSSERVEYAIRLPGTDDTPVYLPIDSKFPGDRYQQLLDAQESGDKARIDAACKALETVIRQEARDIREKYISVPYTTNFGILFLPFEGLYAEAVNRGLVEVLQREFRISIAGPSTMAAYLNSLQMGFRTLAIQKQSSKVWEILGGVRTEFEKYQELLKKMQGHLELTSRDLENLLGTRTNAVMRKLRGVEALEPAESASMLELPEEF